MNSLSRAKQNYNNKNYERVEFKVVKGDKAKIKAYAESMGLSTNELIKRSISAYTGLELPSVSEVKGS